MSTFNFYKKLDFINFCQKSQILVKMLIFIKNSKMSFFDPYPPSPPPPPCFWGVEKKSKNAFFQKVVVPNGLLFENRKKPQNPQKLSLGGGGGYPVP